MNDSFLNNLLVSLHNDVKKLLKQRELLNEKAQCYFHQKESIKTKMKKQKSKYLKQKLLLK